MVVGLRIVGQLVDSVGPLPIHVIVISIVSICLASWIFLGKPSKYSQKIPSTPSKIEIRWGEGSEADMSNPIVK